MDTAATAAFIQSLGIIAREGFEVVLILGAMFAVVRKSSVGREERGLWWGAGLAVVASLLTAALVQRVFSSAAQLEVLEGATMLLAAVVLFGVGHWLLSKADVARWRAYVRSRVASASGTGSYLALGAVAFLAVYREGVETVLFYRALLSAEAGSSAAIAAGFVAGVAALALLCAAIFRLGVRIPLRPFFAGTSALLLLLAFVFAGKGVHELQEGGVLTETVLGTLRVGPLGIYPTLETLAAQAALLLAIVVPLALRSLRNRTFPDSARCGAPEQSSEARVDAAAS